MRKAFTTLAVSLIALTCASSAWAEANDRARAKHEPIAFGSVNSNGSVASGSGNFKVKLETNTYHIKIKKIDYFFSSYATMVTPFDQSATHCATESVGGDLLVYCFDTSGNPKNVAFSFVTF